MLAQNKAMKVFTYIFAGFWALYLMLFGVLFGTALNDLGYESFDWIDGGMIFFLCIDFYLRFSMQETPAQEIRPYKMLAVPQKFLLNLFLLRLPLQTYNFIWFFFFVPFAFLSIWVNFPGYYGFWGFVGYLFGWWLLYMLNSYWYLIWRTLNQRSVFYLLIPTAVYAVLIYFGIFFDEHHTWLFDGCLELGRAFLFDSGMAWFNGTAYVLLLLCSAFLFWVNRKMQYEQIYAEIAGQDKVEQVNSMSMSWLNSLGTIGEYIKLDIKSTFRNKVPRQQFITGAICTIMFCALFAFTDVYDEQPFMQTFICVYCFAVMGTINLTNVMAAEGNYIDLLMSRKESILSLLKAKYYFNSILLLVPFLFALLPVLKGKMYLVEAVGCAFFAMGCIFPFLFQLAVYNKDTLPLNVKLTRTGKSTKHQMIFSFAALFVPMIIMYVLVVLFSKLTAGYVMLGMGLLGVLLNPWWLRNIYHRFMLRRYDNMQGFRATRTE